MPEAVPAAAAAAEDKKVIDKSGFGAYSNNVKYEKC